MGVELYDHKSVFHNSSNHDWYSMGCIMTWSLPSQNAQVGLAISRKAPWFGHFSEGVSFGWFGLRTIVGFFKRSPGIRFKWKNPFGKLLSTMAGLRGNMPSVAWNSTRKPLTGILTSSTMAGRGSLSSVDGANSGLRGIPGGPRWAIFSSLLVLFWSLFGFSVPPQMVLCLFLSQCNKVLLHLWQKQKKKKNLHTRSSLFQWYISLKIRKQIHISGWWVLFHVCIIQYHTKRFREPVVSSHILLCTNTARYVLYLHIHSCNSWICNNWCLSDWKLHCCPC